MLKFENVHKKYGSKFALSEFNYTFESGKVYALVGPNGSGKSTMMKMAAGLVKADIGTVSFNGEPISYTTRASIAYMPTEAFYYDYMSIETVANYYQDFYTDFSRDEFFNLLRFMGLEQNAKVKALSSGMAAKLKIAATLARKASVIMLDEPLNGIDLIARDQIINSIIGSTAPGSTFIISSHLFDELEPIVDNVVMLKDGKLAIHGNIDDIRQQYGKSISDLYREIYGLGLQFTPVSNGTQQYVPVTQQEQTPPQQ